MLNGKSYLFIKAMFLLHNKSIVYPYRQINYLGKYGCNECTYHAYQNFILLIKTVVFGYFNAPLPEIVIEIS